MLGTPLGRLRTLEPGVGRGVIVLAALALTSTLLEAMALVVIVAAAAGVAGASGSVTVAPPALGGPSVPITAALVFAGLAVLGSAVGRLLLASARSRLQSRVFRSARDRTIAAFQAASWPKQAAEREGSLQETVTTLASRAAQLAGQVADLVVGVLSFSGLLAVALVVDARVTAVVTVASLALFGVLRPLTRITRRHARSYALRNAAFAEDVSAWVSSAQDLRVFGVESQAASRLQDANAETAEAQRRASLSVQVGADLYRELVLVGLVVAVAAVYLSGTTDLVPLGAVVLLIVRSLAYGQQAQRSVQLVGEGEPSLEELRDRIASLEAAAVQPGRTSVTSLGEIEVRGVSYTYPDGRRGVEDVDLVLRPGEALGAIGPSGGGKTTLVQLLLRLRQPTRGSIRVAGHLYDDIDAADWSRLVSLVPQEPRLFAGTVFENVRYHRTWITADAVRSAIAAAHLAADVANLPQREDTMLGPRGMGLSGGQKQRLAIARALAGGPQFLVLDEPTSALDVRSEDLLRETICALKGTVTLLIVAHRLSTLSACDRVLVLDDGRPKLIGSLAEAVASAGFLRDGVANGGTAAR